MEIGPVNNNNKLLNNTDKSQKSAQGSNTEDVSSSSLSKSRSPTSESDKLQLTNLSSSNEVRFAKTVLQNLKSLSFEELSEVRDKIQKGEFNTPEVTEKVSKEVAGQITFLESAANTENSLASSISDVKANLSNDVKEKLINNEEVLNNISSRLLDSLVNL